jgi:hypothetical protein
LRGFQQVQKQSRQFLQFAGCRCCHPASRSYGTICAVKTCCSILRRPMTAPQKHRERP